MLAFESGISYVLGAACQKKYDSDAMLLAEADTIIRRDLVRLNNSFKLPMFFHSFARLNTHYKEGPNIKISSQQPIST